MTDELSTISKFPQYLLFFTGTLCFFGNIRLNVPTDVFMDEKGNYFSDKSVSNSMKDLEKGFQMNSEQKTNEFNPYNLPDDF